MERLIAYYEMEQNIVINMVEMKPREKENDGARDVKNTIAVMSGKGGVGKTTVAVNISVYLASMGYRVGIIDADLTGPNVPKMLGVEDAYPTFLGEGKIGPVQINDKLSVISMAYLLESRDSPVIWRGPLKMGAIKQFINDVEWGELDFLMIDLPPGTGDEALSVAQLITKNSHAIIVTTPQEVALLDARKSINFAKKLNMTILGVVENMSGMICPHCQKTIDLFGKGGGRKAAKELDVNFLGEIPLHPEMVAMGDSGKPITSTEDERSESFKKIGNNIIKDLGL